MASETLAKLVVKMEADSARLQKDLDKANSRIDRFSKSAGGSMDKLGATFVKLAGTVAAFATGAAFTSFVKASFEMIDVNAKAADKLGIMSEKLQGMQYAASLAGIGSEDFNKSLQKMEKTVYDAQQGLSTAKDAISQLGLNLDDLAKMSPDKQFNVITDAISNLGSQTDKVGISMAIFGKAGADVLNLVGDTEGQFKKATEEAIAFNLALTRVDSAKVEAANDAMTRVSAAARGVGNTISVALSPYIAEIGNQFADSAKASHGFQDAVDKALRFIAKAVGFVADMFRGLHAVWKGLEVAFFGLTSLVVRGLEAMDRAIVNTLNLLPGIDIKPSDSLSQWAESTANSLSEAQSELYALVTTPMPSEDIDKWFEKVRTAAQKAAEEIGKTKSKLLAPPGEGVAAVETNKKEQDRIASDYLALQKSLMSKRELEDQSYKDQQFAAENAYQSLAIGYESYIETLNKLDEKRQKQLQKRSEEDYQLALDQGDAMVDLYRKNEAKKEQIQSDAFKNTSAVFGNLAILEDGHNRKSFKRAKQLARAQAAVDAIAAGIAAAKSAASLGPFAAFAAYAATYTGLAAKIYQIESTHYEGGGGGGGLSGGAPTATSPNSTQSGLPISNTSNQRNPVVIQVTVNGSVYSTDIQEIVVDAVREYTNNDGVIVARNSAQAREIMRA